jgi:hypothetical protein
MAEASFRVATGISILCDLEGRDGSGSCARRRRIDWYQRGAAQYLKVVGIVGWGGGTCGLRRANSGAWRCNAEGKERGNGEEGEGV